MSALQWALLIIAVVAVVAVYLFSRRDRRAMERGRAGPAEEPLLPPRDQQLDIFAGGQFDELGVGKPRRIEPTIGDPRQGSWTEDTSLRQHPSVTEAGWDDDRQSSIHDSEAPHRESEGSSSKASQGSSRKKIVALLLAERGGHSINGQRVHEALRAQGLQYGDRNIYHRMSNGDSVFSVASLVKPGHLDAARAKEFSTPGLTLFMVLPGPQQPSVAIRDMLETAGKLASSLNAQLFDSNRQLLTPNASQALQDEVYRWAAHGHELS